MQKSYALVFWGSLMAMVIAAVTSFIIANPSPPAEIVADAHIGYVWAIMSELLVLGLAIIKAIESKK